MKLQKVMQWVKAFFVITLILSVFSAILAFPFLEFAYKYKDYETLVMAGVELLFFSVVATLLYGTYEFNKG